MNKKRLLILLPGSQEKFNIQLIKKINQHFYDKQITFIFLCGKSAAYSKFSNVVHVAGCGNGTLGRLKMMTQFVRQVYSHDILMLSSLFFSWKIMLVSYFSSFFKETGWIVWGGDLYEDEDSRASFVNTLFIMRSRFVALPIDQDAHKLFEKYEGYSGIVTSFWFPLDVDLFRSQVKLCDYENHENKNNIVRILVGHSSDPSNRHVDIINMLQEFLPNNFIVVMPLNYGDHKYAEYVSEYAKEKLGRERLEIYRDFIDFSAYCSLLMNVDVAIFHQRRQQAGHNILLLANLRKKIFINKMNTFYGLLCDVGVEVYDSDCIADISFNEFKFLGDAARSNNFIYSEVLMRDDYFVSRLSQFFSDLGV